MAKIFSADLQLMDSSSYAKKDESQDCFCVFIANEVHAPKRSRPVIDNPTTLIAYKTWSEKDLF